MDETLKEYKQRINSLKIPPNWKSVQVSKDPTDYLQVSGVDGSGKTQYIYHPLFIQLTTSDKFSRINDFISNLPKINKKIDKDLHSKDEKTFLIAFMFLVLQKTYIRIGNECYAKNNDTYGLTTLQKRHISIEEDDITIKFKGKRSILFKVTFKNKYISKVLRKLLNNCKHSTSNVFQTTSSLIIKSNDMNEYLKEYNATCKDFRTYFSNILFIEGLSNGLKEISSSDINISSLKKIVNKVYNDVAEKLGHSRSISKKAYIFPFIAESFIEGHESFRNCNVKELLRKLIKNN